MTASQVEASKSLEWIQRFYEASDSLDAERWIKGFYTPDAEFTFAHRPTMHGLDETLPAMSMQCSKLETMKHVRGHVNVLPDKIYQEATIHYIVKVDPEKENITGQGFAVFHKGAGDEKMQKFDVYGDFSKVTEKVMQYAV